MATLTFGGPVFAGASNSVVVRNHADRPRGDRMPTRGAGRTAAPAPSPSGARPAQREEPSDRTAATRAATRHQLVAFRVSPDAVTVSSHSRSRGRGRSGRHIVVALPLDDGRLSRW
jgi:hypothetical protein